MCCCSYDNRVVAAEPHRLMRWTWAYFQLTTGIAAYRICRGVRCTTSRTILLSERVFLLHAVYSADRQMHVDFFCVPLTEKMFFSCAFGELLVLKRRHVLIYFNNYCDKSHGISMTMTNKKPEQDWSRMAKASDQPIVICSFTFFFFFEKCWLKET